MSDNTYGFMEQNMDKRYEIAAYDNIDYDKKRFRQLVRMTKSLFN